eukprot:5008602-Alexandrium_andersonii.AAC.1
MDALLVMLITVHVVLGEERAGDRTADLLGKGCVRADAEPVVDVARGASGIRGPEMLDVAQASRVHEDGVAVRRWGRRSVESLAEDALWGH